MRTGILAVLFNLVSLALRTVSDPKQKLKKYLFTELMNNTTYDPNFFIISNYHEIKIILIA